MIVATNPKIDELVKDLKTFKFEEPPTVKVIESTQVVTIEKVKSVFANTQNYLTLYIQRITQRVTNKHKGHDQSHDAQSWDNSQIWFS